MKTTPKIEDNQTHPYFGWTLFDTKSTWSKESIVFSFEITKTEPFKC